MKKLITMILFSWLASHFLFTFLYLAPKNPLYQGYDEIVTKYMGTLFSQDWSLFAPEPATSSLKLWYRCQNEPRRWRDALNALQQEHQRNRFTFRGKLNYIYMSLVRNLHNEYVTLNKDNKCAIKGCHQEITELDTYQSLKKLTNQLCRSTFPQDKNLDFKIVTYHPPTVLSEEKKGDIEFLSFK